jgi:hypothetical protein
MNYKKFFIVIALIFNFMIIFAQEEDSINTFFIRNWDQDLYENQLLSQRVKIPPIQEVSVLDSTLILIIDSVLDQEKNCPYFSKDLCLSLLFARKKDTLYKNYYCIQIELCDKNILLDLNPIGYFFHQDRYVFIYDIIKLPEVLFSYLNIKKDFNHYNNYDDYVIDDDRYSMYIYWYINNQFFFEKAYKCLKNK